MKNAFGVALVASSFVWGCGGSSDEAVPGGSTAPTTSDAGALPLFPTSADLRAVWGSSRTDVWAVGTGGTIVHFDGRSWTLIPGGTTELLTGVAGTGPGDAWITGEEGSVLHWNGEAWSIATQDTDTTLLAVWANGPADVWYAGIDWTGGPLGDGSGYILHWNGTDWADADVGATSLWAVWASGPDDVWIVGDTRRGTDSSRAVTGRPRIPSRRWITWP